MLFQMNMVTLKQWHRRTVITGEDKYEDWWRVKASTSGMFPKSQITTGWLNFKLHRMTIMATSSLLHNVPFNRGKRNRVLWIQTEHYNSPPRPSDLSGRYRACKWTNSSRTHTCVHKQTDELFTHQVPLLCKLRIGRLIVNIPLLPSFHHLLFRPHYLEKQTNSQRHMRSTCVRGLLSIRPRMGHF